MLFKETNESILFLFYFKKVARNNHNIFQANNLEKADLKKKVLRGISLYLISSDVKLTKIIKKYRVFDDDLQKV